MSMNWDDALKLLHIADMANKWPKLRSIHDAALRELEKHSVTAAKDNEEAAKAKAEEESKAKAKLAEEAKKQAEAEEAKEIESTPKRKLIDA